MRRKATKRWQIPRRGQAVVLVGVAMAVAVTLFQVSPASAEPPIYGAIRVKWEQLGGYAGLGAPLDEEHDTYDLVGRTQTFRGGVISWHPKIGEAFAVWGDILTTWTRLGRERWAYPVTDEWGTPDGVGRYNHFRVVGGEERSIYWTPATRAQPVLGDFRRQWKARGWERGTLGYPTSGEYGIAGPAGRVRQDFQGGYLTWHADPPNTPEEDRTGGTAVVAPPEAGARPLLVILLKGIGKGELGHPASYYENMAFGPAGTSAVPEYFAVNSGSRFTFRRAGLVQVQDRKDPALGTTHGDDVDFVHRAVQLAGEAGFDFSAYDTIPDGIVYNWELAILVISNYADEGGATRWACQRPPRRGGGTQAVQFCGMRATADHRSSFLNVAHELAHTLDPVASDVYGGPCWSAWLTLMSCTLSPEDDPVHRDQRYEQVLLDPMHRLRYGWLTEAPIRPGTLSLGATATANIVPACRASHVLTIQRDATERFLIERRRRCLGDWSVKNDGIIVWHFREHPGFEDPIAQAPDTNTALRSIGCVFDASNVASKPTHDNPTGVGVTGGRHRLRWADGVDAGFDLTIGTGWADGTIPVTVTRTDAAPARSC